MASPLSATNLRACRMVSRTSSRTESKSAGWSARIRSFISSTVALGSMDAVTRESSFLDSSRYRTPRL